jgi:hypothetical protein
VLRLFASTFTTARRRLTWCRKVGLSLFRLRLSTRLRHWSRLWLCTRRLLLRLWARRYRSLLWLRARRLLLRLWPRRHWSRLWLCTRRLLLRLRSRDAWRRLASHWRRFATHLRLLPLLRNNYTALLLLRCCNAFALRLLLSHGSRRTLSLRCACTTIDTALFVLLLPLLLLDAALITLRISVVPLLRLSLRSSRL